MLTILVEYLKLYLLDNVAYNQIPIQQEKDQWPVLMYCLVQTLYVQELHSTSRGGCHLCSTNNVDTIPGYGVFVWFIHYFVGDGLKWATEKCYKYLTT